MGHWGHAIEGHRHDGALQDDVKREAFLIMVSLRGD